MEGNSEYSGAVHLGIWAVRIDAFHCKPIETSRHSPDLRSSGADQAMTPILAIIACASDEYGPLFRAHMRLSMALELPGVPAGSYSHVELDGAMGGVHGNRPSPQRTRGR